MINIFWNFILLFNCFSIISYVILMEQSSMCKSLGDICATNDPLLCIISAANCREKNAGWPSFLPSFVSVPLMYEHRKVKPWIPLNFSFVLISANYCVRRRAGWWFTVIFDTNSSSDVTVKGDLVSLPNIRLGYKATLQLRDMLHISEIIWLISSLPSGWLNLTVNAFISLRMISISVKCSQTIISVFFCLS